MMEDLNNHKCDYVLLPFIDTGQIDRGSHVDHMKACWMIF